jgi:hypothetical protein
MVYELHVQGVDEAARNLADAGAYAVQQQHDLAQEFGSRVQAAVRGRATGRPGPNVVTGAYLASIQYLVQNTGAGYEAVVYSDAPQSMRLELGFYGTDSLGRTYAVGPFPHFAPAYQEQYPAYVAAQARLAAQVAAVGNGGPGDGGRGGGMLGRLGGMFGRLR